jgi:hypothetical protein
MNRAIKEATVKRYHYDDHAQLAAHLENFGAAYNFARRLKTLKGLTPYEAICKMWTKEPERFRLDPIHQMPGLNRPRRSRKVQSSTRLALTPRSVRSRSRSSLIVMSGVASISPSR